VPSNPQSSSGPPRTKVETPVSPAHGPREVAPVAPTTLLDAMALIPTGVFVLTSSYAEIRGGVIVRWVQTVSTAPPLVVVAIEKGQPLSPIIRDSRRFGLCQLAPEDRVLRRLFEAESREGERGNGPRVDPIDPFLGLPTKTTATGVPVLLKSQAWLECELTRHLDVEGNCELYIGLVHAGGVLRPALHPDALAPNALAPAADLATPLHRAILPRANGVSATPPSTEPSVPGSSTHGFASPERRHASNGRGSHSTPPERKTTTGSKAQPPKRRGR
jgi:flavin reductase (DIM6/NTAB) family NADH-FMN oxidoreductase RutF